MMKMTDIRHRPDITAIITRAEAEIKTITGMKIKLKPSKKYVLDDEFLLKLQELVCKHFNVSWDEIQDSSRFNQGGLVDARHTYMFIAHKELKYTLKAVALQCARKDHTSVSSAIKKIEGFYDIKDGFVKHVETIKKKLLYENID